METPKNKAFDAAEERSIAWATRNHTTSMVQTVHRSKQPSDGKVCGLRASRKSLMSGRSLLAKPKTDRFATTYVNGVDDVRDVRPVTLSDTQRKANMRGFMANRRITGQ